MLDFNSTDPPAPPDFPAVEIALKYAARGWPVFPCNPLNKRPMTEHGFKQATTNDFQIRSWWAKYPLAMIGIPTGVKSGFWALDIDMGGEKDGLASLATTDHYLEELTDTAVSRTGSGGYHCLFRFDPTAPVTNARGGLPRHIDVRGEGGYIIAPGSRLSDGREYAWLNPPDEMEIADPPAWLSDLLQTGQPTGQSFDFNSAKPTVSPAARVAAIEPGRWHENTRDLVARMVREGASDDTIAAIAPRFTEPGYSDAQTIAEFLTHARTARTKWGYKPTLISSSSEPAANTSDVFKLYSVDELIDIEPPEWRIDGIFPCHGTSTLYGAYETFKTFVALSFSLSLASGRDWFGRPTKPCPVLYIAGEGQTGIGLRVAGWFKSQGLDHRDASFLAIPEAIAMPSPGDQDKLLRTIDGFSDQIGSAPGLIVFDTVTRMTGGGSLNDEKDVQAYIRGSDRIRTHTHAHVMHLGHAGKDKEKGIMGSTVLPAAMETIICVERKGDSLTLINSNPKGKQKDGPNFEDIRLATRIVHFDHKGGQQKTVMLMPDQEVIKAQPETERPQRLGARQQAVLTALAKAARDGQSLGFTRLSMMTNMDHGGLGTTLRSLVDRGLIEEVGSDENRQWKVVS